mmetsp:Transcript_6922/g.23114  ORF Transcript_6922/g.23114 Transcript_6922/m.23114 type:complete len:214 (-) Transcript_6922:150-791(-)
MIVAVVQTKRDVSSNRLGGVHETLGIKLRGIKRVRRSLIDQNWFIETFSNRFHELCRIASLGSGRIRAPEVRRQRLASPRAVARRRITHRCKRTDALKPLRILQRDSQRTVTTHTVSKYARTRGIDGELVERARELLERKRVHVIMPVIRRLRGVEVKSSALGEIIRVFVRDVVPARRRVGHDECDTALSARAQRAAFLGHVFICARQAREIV